MPRPPGLPIDRDDIIDAALAILREDGFEAVSMRSVAAKLGVSPFPLYSRVGNKEAMLDAIADRLVTDASPAPAPGEHWAAYADRWARSLRARLHSAPELGKVLGTRRQVYIGAVDPLVATLRASGVERDDAVRSARLLLWSTVGFAIVEGGALRTSTTHRDRGRKSGGDPAGVAAADADALFDQHLRYVIDGLARELG
jgi:TetR/AcrR family transcriptional regulator, tetracycline repressor protein